MRISSKYLSEEEQNQVGTIRYCTSTKYLQKHSESSGQIYTDFKAGEKFKSTAQGLITLATYGVGMLIGFRFAGWLTDQYVTDSGQNGYAIDMTKSASEGKLDPVIGRDEEIRRTIQVLSRVSNIVTPVPKLIIKIIKLYSYKL